MFRKTTLIVTMLVAAAQIHPEIACSKLLRTDKTADGKTPSVFLSARPHPACAVYLGLVLYHNKDKRAFCALQYLSSLSELSAESGADLRRLVKAA